VPLAAKCDAAQQTGAQKFL
jgi:hypothetical protein